MKAYVVVQETVKDEEAFAAYRAEVVATLAPYQGRFVVRGGNLSVVEGQWAYPRLVILEFPSREAAFGWYQSAAYQAVLPLRLASCESNLVIVDGIE